jgi:hypothetical protein
MPTNESIGGAVQSVRAARGLLGFRI